MMVGGSSELLTFLRPGEGFSGTLSLWHWPVRLQETKASLPGIVDAELEVRCKTDTCEWLIWRVQNNSLRDYWWQWEDSTG